MSEDSLRLFWLHAGACIIYTRFILKGGKSHAEYSKGTIHETQCLF